jgi:hypothetical protein
MPKKSVEGAEYEEGDVVTIIGEEGVYRIVGVYKKDTPEEPEFVYDLEPDDSQPNPPDSNRYGVPEDELDIF